MWTLDSAMKDAAAFAAEVGREQLISITHYRARIVVWYWSEEFPPKDQFLAQPS